MHQRLLRNDAARAHVDGKNIEWRIHLDGLASGKFFTGPIIYPLALGQHDFVRLEKWPELGRNQHRAPEHVFFPVRGERCFGGKFQEQGAHQRDPGAAGFFHTGVDVGHQAVTGLDVFLANRFMHWPVYPRFAIARALGGMVPVNWIKGSNFHPSGQQFRSRAAVESADIVAHEGISRDAQVR